MATAGVVRVATSVTVVINDEDDVAGTVKGKGKLLGR
jgi:hypothetical protein